MKQRTRLKIQLPSYLSQIFPELRYFFKPTLHQKSVYVLLKEALTLKGIYSMHMIHPTNLLKVNSHRYFTKKQTKELEVLAQKSFGVNDSTLSIHITHSIVQNE